MALLDVSNISVLGIATCVPKEIQYTAHYTHISDAERTLFAKTTGITERRVAPAHVSCSDLCFQASEKLLSKFNCKEEIDLVIFVSQSPDYFLPATAVILQQKLGLKKNCLAFDINLGCSGYVYGLSVISSLMQNGQLKKALLLAGDKSTISTSFTDKSAYPLFGDAGTATLLQFNKEAGTMHFHLQSDGSGKNSIIIEHGHSRHPYSAESDIVTELEPGISRAKKHLALDGMDIFNFALREVAANTEALLEHTKTAKETIDYFVFHQANKLINESVRKKLKVEKEKVPYSIELFGNTSSASIPLTLCYSLASELSSKKLRLLLSGFGVGYSWGSVLLETDQIYTDLSEYADN